MKYTRRNNSFETKVLRDYGGHLKSGKNTMHETVKA